jgi:hypothetical protein
MITRRPVKYLSNRNLLEQLDLSHGQSRMTNELAKMLMMLTERYAKRPNWRNYSYNDEMQADAIAHLCNVWHKFDRTRSPNPNPFAFFTTCITNIFIRRLKLEQKQGEILDKIAVQNDLPPSWRAYDTGDSAWTGPLFAPSFPKRH